MKKNKIIPLVILLSILVLLVIAYVFLSGNNSESDRETNTTEEQTPAIPVCAFTAEAVTEISYKTKDLDISLVKTGSAWQIADDEKFPVDQSAVAKMISSVTALSASRKLEDGDVASYGLDKPTLTVTFTADGTSHVFAVGNVNSYNDMTYLGYGDNVFVIADTLTDTFKKTKTELFGKGESFPSAITAESVNSVSVTDAKSKQGTVTDAKGISDFVFDAQKYISFSIPKGYGLDADGLASYGIDESSAKVVIEYEHSSAKATFEFLLGKDADGKCYYALPNSDVTYGIDVTGYDKLLNYVYHTAEETTTE